jgi:hypothetical protein
MYAAYFGAFSCCILWGFFMLHTWGFFMLHTLGFFMLHTLGLFHAAYLIIHYPDFGRLPG